MHPALAATPIRRIAVFRALVLGDLLCATPALRAIKAAWPDAELTLVGLPWAAGFAARQPSVDRFEAFPGHPGLPETAPDLAAFPGFLARMRAARFDLAVQLHGSGDIVNALVARFGARLVAGFADLPAGAADPCVDERAAGAATGPAADPRTDPTTASAADPGTTDRTATPLTPGLHTPWPRRGHEIERLLALVDHLGLARRGTQLDFGVADADRAALARAVPELGADAAFVCVHPGAQLPSRRWPAERFAAVADALADRGLRVVLTGTAGEAPITAAVRSRMRASALDLAGRTDLFGLGALVERARLVVCNDTGVLHVAAALGTPSVAVSSGADVARWAPLDAARHPVCWHDVPCRPCAWRDCPLPGHDCARGVGVAEVVALALAALAARAPEPVDA